MKRYLVIFLVFFVSLFFLFAGIFGKSGFLYNQSLKSQIFEKQMKSEKLSIDIENLRKQEITLSSEDGIRDSAISMGLYVEGDSVYLFDAPALQENQVKSQITPSESYEPLTSFSVFLIAFAISVIITFIIWFLSKDNNNDEDYSQIQNGSDMYINA